MKKGRLKKILATSAKGVMAFAMPFALTGCDNKSEINVRVEGDYIQWQVDGNDEWTNLLSVEEVKDILGESYKGDPGSKWTYETTNPKTEDGENGDYYINTSTGEIFYKTNNEWIFVIDFLAEKKVLCGDIDGDGFVSVSDVILLRKYLTDAEQNPLTDAQILLADVDSNKSLNDIDVEILRKYLAGGYGIDALPCTNYMNYGDIDGDGFVSVSDIILLRNYLTDAEQNPLTDAQILLADVDSNKSLNDIDIEILRKYIAGGYGIDSLPYTNYIMYGDIDGDGFISTSDLIYLRQHISNPEQNPLTEKQLLSIDVNLDGFIDSKDVDILRAYLAGGYGVDTLPYLGQVPNMDE